MQAAVIFDMDGTLADCSHRLHWVRGAEKKNWKRFFEGVSQDEPRPEIVRLAQELSQNNAIIIASGRPENLRKATIAWLEKYEVPFDAVFLRPEGDFRKDGEVKAEMIEFIRAQNFNPWLSIDDRQSAVDAWRSLGICCLQCDEGDY